MKCKELIAELQKFDPELNIQIESSLGEYAPIDIQTITVINTDDLNGTKEGSKIVIYS